MSITDELRELQEHWKGIIGEGGQVVIANIADRIDAEHKKQMADAFTKGVIDGIDMAEHSTEYAKLPVDADGEVIHIGDVMERMERCGKVVALQLSDNPWEDGNHWAIQLEGEKAPTVLDAFFHHHEPTVEDVLREFALEIDPSADIAVTGAETIKKFAAKLQLKETE